MYHHTFTELERTILELLYPEPIPTERKTRQAEGL